jgi:hypothetical protein
MKGKDMWFASHGKVFSMGGAKDVYWLVDRLFA